MSKVKVVVINLGEGNWERGFPVMLQIGEEGDRTFMQFKGRLPGAGDIPQHYETWQFAYRRLPEILRLDIPNKQVSNVSKPENCHRAARVLQNSLNIWLNSELFRPIKDRLQQTLNPSERIRVIIQTEDFYGKRLPWHLWDLFERYPKAEVSLSALAFDPTRPHSSRKKLRTLAVLGNSEGIRVDVDRECLERLPGCDTVFLVEPTRRQIGEQLWEQDWDILFFAGHSSTNNGTGTISINPTESLTLGELKHGLRKAIEGGLQLAIFNSCDGLGLARELQHLGIPQVIVMREPVPDKVAQAFLKYFLTAFAKGQSLYLAVRTARERLHDEGWEKEIPGVTWLPVICQNPTAVPMAWPENLPEPNNYRDYRGLVKLVGGIATFVVALSVSFFVWHKLKNGDEYSLGDRYSFGEEFLLEQTSSNDARLGAESFYNRDYEKARRYFLNALKSERNNPELLIYLNNARAVISGKPITTIAVSIPGTDAKDQAKELLRGVAQFQAENNCGIEPIIKAIENQAQLNCQGSDTALRVLIADHENRNDLPKIRQRFEKIVADSRIIGLIGRYNSSMTFAIEEKIVNDGIIMPVISTTSTAMRTRDRDVSGYIFRTSPTDADSAGKWYDYLDRNGARRLVILFDNDRHSDYSRSLRGELYKLLPEAVKEQSYDCDLSKIDACLDEIQGQSIDAIVLAPSDNRKFIDAARHFVNRYGAPDAPYEGDPIVLGGDTLYNQQILDEILKGGLLERLVVSVPWHRSQNPTAFEQDALKLWVAPINWRTAMAYDAAKLLATATGSVTNCSDARACRQAVRDAMLANGLDNGATGEIRFSKDGNRIVESGDRVSVLVGVNLANRTFECIPGEFCAE